MAASVQIKSLNHTHLAIIDWLVLNPERSLGECAREMGFTQSWLSVIVHSDMFQAAYKEVCEQRHCEAVHTIVSEMGGLAALGIAKMAEKIESGAASERLLTEATRTALEGLGYIGKASGAGASAQASISIVVDPEKLRAARERARGRFEGVEATPALAGVVEVSAGSGQEGGGEVARPTPSAMLRASIEQGVAKLSEAQPSAQPLVKHREGWEPGRRWQPGKPGRPPLGATPSLDELLGLSPA